jgi:hypothetical protein
MVAFFEANTEVKFAFGKNYPDYHPDHPGGVEEGRSIHTLPFDGRKLGRDLALLAQPMAESTFMGMGLNSGPDLKHFLNATRSAKSAAFVASRMLEHGRDVLLHGRGTRLVNGNALAARLFKTVLDRKIEIWRSAKAVSLDKADNRIVGAIVRKGEGQTVEIKARVGVVLAGGGFAQNDELRKQHFHHVKGGASHVTLAAEGSTGDGLRMAHAVGARVEDSYANAAAWVPVSLIQRRDGSIGRFFHLIDRAKPGVIAVTADGRRFTNESHKLRPSDDRGLCRQAGRIGVYDLRSPHAPPLWPRRGAAGAVADRRVHSLRLSEERPDRSRSCGRGRARSGSPVADHRCRQSRRGTGTGPVVRPRRNFLSAVARR